MPGCPDARIAVVPPLEIPGRNHIDMSPQNQRRVSRARHPDHPIALTSTGLLAKKSVVSSQGRNVELPSVDVEAGVTQHLRVRLLQVGLGIGRGHARHPDESDKTLDEWLLVNVLECPGGHVGEGHDLTVARTRLG